MVQRYTRQIDVPGSINLVKAKSRFPWRVRDREASCEEKQVARLRRNSYFACRNKFYGYPFSIYCTKLPNKDALHHDDSFGTHNLTLGPYTQASLKRSINDYGNL
jgi:hypothetical protein